MRGGAPIGLAAGLMLLPEVSFAAPAGMLNKTVSVTTEIAIPARADSGQTLTARRSIQKVMYISSAGRVFSRTGRQAGRARETTEVAPAAKDGAPRIEGNTLVGTMGLISGAVRMVVSFDGSFSSCTATFVTGRESGRAITWKGIDGNVYTATGPVSVSTPSCSVQPGNAFAGQ